MPIRMALFINVLKLEFMSAIVNDPAVGGGGWGSSQQFVFCNASKTTIVRNAYLRVILSQSEMCTVP